MLLGQGKVTSRTTASLACLQFNCQAERPPFRIVLLRHCWDGLLRELVGKKEKKKKEKRKPLRRKIFMLWDFNRISKRSWKDEWRTSAVVEYTQWEFAKTNGTNLDLHTR